MDVLLVQATRGWLDDALTFGGVLASPTELWLWLCLALMIVEIFTAGFFLGALSLSALLTAGVSAVGVGPQGQLAAFAVLSIAGLGWLRPFAVKLLDRGDVVTNTDALVGSAATVTARIPAGGVGRVQLVNEEWRATATESLQAGDAVQVVAVKGNTLSVARP